MGDAIERFPLFPLGLVLLPGETVPLHIFEERYKTMIGECVAQESEFGIVWLADDELHTVGCAAEVARVLETTEDGRMNILAQGTRPFDLRRRVDDLAYPAGDVVLLDDEEIEAPEEDAESSAAREAYAKLVERVTDKRPEDADLAELDAYGMAATIAFEPADKQELLELRSEPARLRRLAELCEQALERVEYAAAVSERASTNGKIHG